MMGKQIGRAVVALIVCGFILSAAAFAGGAEVVAGRSGLSWAIEGQHAGVALTVTGPGGLVYQESFAAGAEPTMALFDKAGYALPDGAYAWELRMAPALSDTVRKGLARARETGDETLAADLRERGVLPSEARVESGAFTILDGSLVSQGLEEEVRLKAGSGVRDGGGEGSPGGFTEDFVINDDLIVTGSTCVGFDCVNGEVFGFDTIRLKENNLRIKFEDTSVGSFPTTDWQLTANDSASGGAGKFSIDEIDTGRTPFTVRAGARTNSIFVDSSGRVGMGTAAPVVSLHVVNGNTPTLRLDQDGTSGFTPQTWDVAGNETNFFIRDATGGSRLPFRIQPLAPTNSIFVNTTGNVGLGTSSPSKSLHVRRTDGTASLFVEEASTTPAARIIGQFNNFGKVNWNFADLSSGNTWQMQVDNRFVFNLQGAGVTAMTVFGTGNVTIAGTLTQSSDRDRKHGIVAVDASSVLAKIAAMPIAEWSYNEDPDVRHVGPMAQDFHAAFGLGSDPRGIAAIDADGVALAAIQALNQKLEEKDEMIRRLEERLTAIEKQLQ